MKYHDIDLRGWQGARYAIEHDLNNELNKLFNVHNVPCDRYILATNVPFTGIRNSGTRDRVQAVCEHWKAKCPEIEVWDASDLSRMLDADANTRTAYLDHILPGDVLNALFRNTTYSSDRRLSAFHSYLVALTRSDKMARTEDAGDLDSQIPLEEIFIDLEVTLRAEGQHPRLADLINSFGSSTNDPFDDAVTATGTEALLGLMHHAILLLGGPGVGKSTLTQFVAIYHASRLVAPVLSNKLTARMKGGKGHGVLDNETPLRYPIRIELRHLAQSFANIAKDGHTPHLAAYIAGMVSGAAGAEHAVVPEDIFGLAHHNAISLILDGLDEVPDSLMRLAIFESLEHFLDRCEGERADIHVLVSSRPQGYRREFSPFVPIEVLVNNLSLPVFNEYSDLWLSRRVKSPPDLKEAQAAVTLALESPAVQQLEKSLLQATVMLTLVAGGGSQFRMQDSRCLASPHPKCLRPWTLSLQRRSAGGAIVSHRFGSMM